MMDEQPNAERTPSPQLPPAAPAMPGAPAVPVKTNGLAVASLVLGILSLLLFFTVVPPFILGILAVVFGAIGISRANQGAGGKGMAVAGLVCGALGVVVAILFIALFVSVANDPDVQDILNSVVQSPNLVRAVI